jgi:Domain of unknown function (DUF1840)
MALVVFRSKAAGEIFMFAETARRIFALLDRELSERGVIAAEQVADALARLTAAVDEERRQLDAARAEREASERRGEAETGSAAQAITLGQRAFPLIEMLRAAAKKRVDVTWGV